MARPQQRQFETDLPEFTPILLRIDSPVQVMKSAQDPEREQVQITFTVLTPPWSEKDPPAKVRQRHGNTVGNQADGTPSFLAQLYHAVHSADLSKSELQDQDSDDLPGKVVEAVGRVKEGEQGRFWNVVTYSRPGTRIPTASPAPAVVALAPNGKPYERIENGHGLWYDGSAWHWTRLPEVAPPPPPPPAAAPPPPPPPPSTSSPAAHPTEINF
jgi:hypothetical protein